MGRPTQSQMPVFCFISTRYMHFTHVDQSVDTAKASRELGTRCLLPSSPFVTLFHLVVIFARCAGPKPPASKAHSFLVRFPT